MRRSHVADSASPEPIAKPSTSATVGLPTDSSRPTMRSIVASYSTPSSAVSNAVNWRMSVPATNAFPPAPRSTIARTSSSPSARSHASNSSSYIANVIALWASGRSKVTHAAGPRTS